MAIYIFQLVFILTVSFVVNSRAEYEQESKRKRILLISFFFMWCVCALKKETVGIDIPGYKRIYEEAAYWPWFLFSKVYYEQGYTVLIQLFSKAGIPFQVFNVFVYTVIYVPWYLFFKRYAKQPTMSLLIYLCYQFWILNMSALRQGMAMSICLLAFMLLEKKRLGNILGFTALVLLASTIHKSAWIFFIALGIYVFAVNGKTLVAFLITFAVCIIFRTNIVTIINSFAGRYQVPQKMTLGGSFLLLCVFTAFAFITIAVTKRDIQKTNAFDIDNASTYMMLCAIALNLVLNGSSILRASAFASMFVTISFPNSLTKCTEKSRVVVDLALIVFLIGLYFTDVLLPNQFEIVPYRFFWQ